MARKKNTEKMSLKEKYQLLRSAGYTSKEAELYRNRSVDKVKKLVKNKEASNQYNKLREAGVSPKEASRLRYAAESTVNKVLKTGKVPPKNLKPSRSGGLKLLILWKDVTDNVGDEFMEDVVSDFKGQNNVDLLESINGWKDMTFGEIGQYTNLLIKDSDLSSTLRMYPGWTKVYFGNGTQYNKLLSKINFMMLALYQDYTKYMFMQDIVDKMNTINPPVAQRLAYDFDLG